MKEVTQLFNDYRECVRNLWNIHFLNHKTSNNGWDLFDAYDEICSKLFTSLVLNKVNKPNYNKASASSITPEPLFFFRVTPSVESGVPVNVSREKNNIHYWDYPLNQIKPNDADMRFVDFFDFDLLGFRDFQFCRVKILNSRENPDLSGHDALLNCNHVKIYFDNTL